MLAQRYEFDVLVARTISLTHLFAALTCEISFLPLENKIHIFSPPCNILYVHLTKSDLLVCYCNGSKDECAFVSVYQVVEGIKPTLLELQKFETAPEDVELEGNC